MYASQSLHPEKQLKKSTKPRTTMTFMLYVNVWQHLYIYRLMLPVWLIQFLVHCPPVINWTENKLAVFSCDGNSSVTKTATLLWVTVALWDQNSKTKKGAVFLFAQNVRKDSSPLLLALLLISRSFFKKEIGACSNVNSIGTCPGIALLQKVPLKGSFCSKMLHLPVGVIISLIG